MFETGTSIYNPFQALKGKVKQITARLTSIWKTIVDTDVSSTNRQAAGEKVTVLEPSGARREEMNRQAERVLEQYGNSILRLAYSYLHNMMEAEDMVQDTIIRYMQSAPEFNSPSHEKAWVLRVAINLCKNKIRYNRVRQTSELDEGLIADEEQQLQFVWEAVKRLPDMYSEVMHLFYQEGYPTAAIAEIIGKKETTVRSLLHRAREKLKQVLKEEYDFDE
ncbi:sigma-70 family RNA polymerase sigma factor [Paenibacillus hunanensis]|uniref:RNA polymerase sigma factor n=1 Tax=Paenibacillus hunanensis TaxID=539262 RepID=UPI00202727F5|nr:sigma-70 family RNA polymerase sigma factor [Paenibacillus hunanensis]MCL9660031.1 sigma-70 family RNA polymerase sigma factor [Paenibacillus hunanensis]